MNDILMIAVLVTVPLGLIIAWLFISRNHWRDMAHAYSQHWTDERTRLAHMGDRARRAENELASIKRLRAQRVQFPTKDEIEAARKRGDQWRGSNHYPNVSVHQQPINTNDSPTRPEDGQQQE